MPRTERITDESAQGKAIELFDGLKKKLGRTPNIFRHMANSPAVLEGYLGLSASAANTSLNAKIREQIALIVAQENKCDYCLAAHTAIGKSVGLEESQIIEARKGQASDAKVQAILDFSQKVVAKNAWVTDEDIGQLKQAGVSDQELTEIIWVIAQNTFTNYFNHIVDPEIDFPQAPGI